MKLSCPDCGAKIKFVPEKGLCHCEHCGMDVIPEQVPYRSDEQTYRKLDCVSCGATLIIDELNVTTKCIYCGSENILLKDLESNFNPSGIIPFKFNEEKALEYYKKFIKKHKKYFKELLNIEVNSNEIKGVYVPHFVNKWNIKLFIDEAHNRCVYNDIEYIEKDVEAKIDNNITDALQDFEMEKLKKFHPAYLAGFYTELADEKENNIKFEREDVKKLFYDKKEYQHVLEENYKLSGNNINYNLTFEGTMPNLLPVWFVNLKNGYRFAINGRTGVVACIVEKAGKERLIFDNITKQFHRVSDIEFKSTLKSKLLKRLLGALAFLCILVFIGFVIFIFSGIEKGILGLVILIICYIPYIIKSVIQYIKS